MNEREMNQALSKILLDYDIKPRYKCNEYQSPVENLIDAIERVFRKHVEDVIKEAKDIMGGGDE